MHVVRCEEVRLKSLLFIYSLFEALVPGLDYLGKLVVARDLYSIRFNETTQGYDTSSTKMFLQVLVSHPQSNIVSRQSRWWRLVSLNLFLTCPSLLTHKSRHSQRYARNFKHLFYLDCAHNGR